MKLYELTEAFNTLLADIEAGRVDPAEEVTDAERGDTITLAEALDRLALDRDTKAENIGLWVKDLVAEAAAIKAEEAALAKRRRTAERRAESLKQYLAECLAGEKFKTARVAISFRHSKAVEISPETETRLVAEQSPRYCVAKWTVSKTLVKDALESGEDIPGAAIVERVSTVIK